MERELAVRSDADFCEPARRADVFCVGQCVMTDLGVALLLSECSVK